MLIYEDDKFIMVPMAMNAFYHSIPAEEKNITYAKNISVSGDFLEKLQGFFAELPAEKEIILDMSNVDYAFKAFEKMKDVTRSLIFMNIDSSFLQDKLQDNLPEIRFGQDRTDAVLNRNYDNAVEQVCSKYAKVLTHKVFVQIIKGLIDEMPQEPISPIRLDSSGLYSNMYVNIKRLFLCPENYYAVLYGLAQKVDESKIEFDGFVSSSKNGAIIANLLGMMLNKKAIHIMGVGPKYAMGIGNLQKEIKKHKNYIYVFDFRCTGTEMKILSALINTNEAYMKGAIGIAVYKVDAEADNMMYLVDIQKEGIPYKIAAEKEDIIKLAGKDVRQW